MDRSRKEVTFLNVEDEGPYRGVPRWLSHFLYGPYLTCVYANDTSTRDESREYCVLVISGVYRSIIKPFAYEKSDKKEKKKNV